MKNINYNKLITIYYNLDSKCENYFNFLISKLNKDFIWNDSLDYIYIKYMPNGLDSFESCYLKSINTLGNLIVLDIDLNEEIEIYFYDLLLEDKLIILDTLENFINYGI